jgi:signal transduction histidine kinase
MLEKEYYSDFTIFDNEEKVIKQAEDLANSFDAHAKLVHENMKSLASGYRRSFREQQRLIRLSDRQQEQLRQITVELQDANKKIVLQKSKQAEMGNMIANISHQWREPLSKLSAINLVTIAKLKAGQKIEMASLETQCFEIENTIDFMSQTMQNFLEFYKVTHIASQFNVYDSIQGILSIIETKILQNNITIVIAGDYSVDLHGIKNEWMQIWLNLINNSIDIFTARERVDPVLKINIASDGVDFCDNGGGMNLEEETNGLGHIMCRDIADKYEAAIHFENGVEGLCVRVRFKLSSEF